MDLPDDLNYDDDVANTPISPDLLNRIRTQGRAQLAADLAVKAAEKDVEQKKKALALVRDDVLPNLLKEARLGEDGLSLDGLQISWKKDVYGSLPSKDKAPVERAAALACLDALAPALIIRELSAELPRNLPSRPTVGQIADLAFQIGKILSVGGAEEIKRLRQDQSDDRMTPLERVESQKRIDAIRDGKDENLTISELIEKIILILVPSAAVNTTLSVNHQQLSKWGREMYKNGRAFPSQTIGIYPVDRATVKAAKGGQENVSL